MSRLATLSCATPLAVTLFLSACGPSAGTPPAEGLRVGLLPDRDEFELGATYAPLLQHLAARTGLPCELTPSDSYTDLLARFRRGELDLALFGGVTLVMARDTAGAVPLVMRDVDVRFRTCLLIRADLAADRLEDCAGLRLSFGPRLSTSGHLMPRYFLERNGLTIETFFSKVRYSERHDATVWAVLDGEVDLGAVNAQVVEDMALRGDFSWCDVRVLWTSPPYADCAWAVRSDLADSRRQALLDAFLELDRGRPEHAAILQPLGAYSFWPVSANDFDSLSEIMRTRELEILR